MNVIYLDWVQIYKMHPHLQSRGLRKTTSHTNMEICVVRAQLHCHRSNIVTSMIRSSIIWIKFRNQLFFKYNGHQDLKIDSGEITS